MTGLLPWSDRAISCCSRLWHSPSTLEATTQTKPEYPSWRAFPRPVKRLAEPVVHSAALLAAEFSMLPLVPHHLSQRCSMRKLYGPEQLAKAWLAVVQRATLSAFVGSMTRAWARRTASGGGAMRLYIEVARRAFQQQL